MHKFRCSGPSLGVHWQDLPVWWIMFRLNHLTRIPGEGPQGSENFTLAEARERLDSEGARGMSDLQLLAILLGAGGWVPQVTIAGNLQELWPNLGALQEWPARKLVRRAGISAGRARRLLAGLELGWRLQHPIPPGGVVVQGPEDLRETLLREFRNLDRERFLALYLDTRHRVLAIDTVSVGTLNASLVHPREVLKGAIEISAAALIVAHNHPSGCARPSGDDLGLTARLDGCAELMGIPLLDHLVVGGEEITSIREYGWPSARPKKGAHGD